MLWIISCYGGWVYLVPRERKALTPRPPLPSNAPSSLGEGESEFGTQGVGWLCGRAGEGDWGLFGSGGFGDEVAGGLLVVEAKVIHCAEEAGVGFIVEGDGDLAGDVVEGFVAEAGIAGHAAAGDFGAQVGEASGEVARGFAGGRGFEGIADVAACGAEAYSEGGGGVLLIGGIVEDGADGLGHGEDVMVAVVGDGGGGSDVQAEGASPAVRAVFAARWFGEEVGVLPVTGGAEIARALAFVAAFGSALGAAVGAGPRRNGFRLNAVSRFLTGAAFVPLFA